MKWEAMERVGFINAVTGKVSLLGNVKIEKFPDF